MGLGGGGETVGRSVARRGYKLALKALVIATEWLFFLLVGKRQKKKEKKKEKRKKKTKRGPTRRNERMADDISGGNGGRCSSSFDETRTFP